MRRSSNGDIVTSLKLIVLNCLNTDANIMPVCIKQLVVRMDTGKMSHLMTILLPLELLLFLHTKEYSWFFELL